MRYTVLLLCPLCLGCGPRRAAKPQASPTPKPSASPVPFTGSFEAPETVISDGKGNRRLALKGGQLSLSPEGDRAMLTGTHAVLYRNGKPVLEIAAKRIYGPKSADTLTAEGSVSAQTSDGRTIRCQTLTWLPNTNQVTGSGGVAFLSGADFALYGSHFTADTLLQTLKILP